MVNQLAHEHMNGHSHGIDMDHPVLALSMTIVSIGIKEGYASNIRVYSDWFIS